jgi:hypothetical protein
MPLMGQETVKNEELEFEFHNKARPKILSSFDASIK